MKMNSKVVRFTKVKILIRKLCTATSKKKKKRGYEKMKERNTSTQTAIHR